MGILDAINSVTNSGNDCVFRLTKDRANKFLKQLKQPGETDVTWNPSPKDLEKYSDSRKSTERKIYLVSF